jgi:hypothetical protein
VDEYSKYRVANKAFILELERQIIEKVDVAIVVFKKNVKDQKRTFFQRSHDTKRS